LYRLGAEIITKYDKERLTHIFIEREGCRGNAVQACDVKDVREIPLHIKTLKWEWVAKCDLKEKVIFYFLRLSTLSLTYLVYFRFHQPRMI
jgi:hypothetical protein